jgi:hypothetical protein
MIELMIETLDSASDFGTIDIDPGDFVFGELVDNEPTIQTVLTGSSKASPVD